MQFIISGSFSQKNSINDRIITIIDEGIDQYNELYIDLHQNPELSLLELKTSEKLQKYNPVNVEVNPFLIPLPA